MYKANIDPKNVVIDRSLKAIDDFKNQIKWTEPKKNF
jgi:hypothetical protein